MLSSLVTSPFKRGRRTTPSPLRSRGQAELVSIVPRRGQRGTCRLTGRVSPTGRRTVVSCKAPTRSGLLAFSRAVLRRIRGGSINRIKAVVGSLVGGFGSIGPSRLGPRGSAFFTHVFKGVSNSIRRILSGCRGANTRVSHVDIGLREDGGTLLSSVIVLSGLCRGGGRCFRTLGMCVTTNRLGLRRLRRGAVPRLGGGTRRSGSRVGFRRIGSVVRFTSHLSGHLCSLGLDHRVAVRDTPRVHLVRGAGRTLIRGVRSSVVATVPL